MQGRLETRSHGCVPAKLPAYAGACTLLILIRLPACLPAVRRTLWALPRRTT